MSANDEILKAVLTSIRHVKSDPTFKIECDEQFKDAGLDSLDRMTMLVEVEESLGVTLDDVDPKLLNTIQDYVDTIAPRLATK